MRGGSPPPNSNIPQHTTRQNEFYDSDHSSASSNYENENRKRANYEEKRQRHRDKMHRDRKMRNDKRGGRNRGDSEVCIFHLEGACNKVIFFFVN
jgi:hypothetical protein